MERGRVTRVVIIGAGNVASHIAPALDKVTEVTQVYSRNIANADEIASRLKNCQTTDDLARIIPDADVYIITVKDDAIAQVIADTPISDGLWLHTSGSIPVTVFKSLRRRYGVLYPLQTFSKGLPVDVSQVPFFIEGCDEATLYEIKALATLISRQVQVADSEQRRRLHIAAVFACNFANHLWTVADEILREAGYDFNVLRPLIQATLDKAVAASPFEGQTGPARRGDRQVIDSHLAMLDECHAPLYDQLTQSIINLYKSSTDE